MLLLLTLIPQVCGSLADGNRRLPRTSRHCNCTEGWGGVNCNGVLRLFDLLCDDTDICSEVCQKDHACNAMMPEGKGGVCYKQGLVVRENYQMCNVTNRKILDQLKGDLPQVSFSCNAEKKECNFQCKTSLELFCLMYLTIRSLGRPEGVLLLRIRHVFLEREQ